MPVVMIHLYWHTTPPAEIERTAAVWRTLNPDADVRLWTPDMILPEILTRAKETIDNVRTVDHVRHFANIVRWHLLHTYGGIWADTDVNPLRPFDPWFDAPRPWCASINMTPTPFVCGGPAGHDLWWRTLTAAIERPWGASPNASGGRLLGRTMEPGELDLVSAGIFADRDPAGTYLPKHYKGRFSTHDWATSRTRVQR